MSASPEAALRLTAILVVAAIIAAVLSLPLGIGIWLPDVFMDRIHALARERSRDGHLFRVVQYRNHGDFYDTKLHHAAPDGSISAHVLDPDDGKRWSASLSMDKGMRMVTVGPSRRGDRSSRW